MSDQHVIEKQKSTRELIHEIPKLWNKVDETRKIAEKAYTLAEHASRGYIELSVEVREMNKNIKRIEDDNKVVNEKLDKILEGDRKLKSWVTIVGGVISIITAIGTLIVVLKA